MNKTAKTAASLMALGLACALAACAPSSVVSRAERTGGSGDRPLVRADGGSSLIVWKTGRDKTHGITFEYPAV